MAEKGAPSPSAQDIDAARRTLLAGERTELAWWRTGLAALAVALAVGRVVPGLDHQTTRWPYEAVGVCFGFYGIVVIAYGTSRRGEVEREQAAGRVPTPAGRAHGMLAAGGVLLGLLTVLLILFN